MCTRTAHVDPSLLVSSYQNLKSHAVTMFEVGKLSDETLDSFLAELEKVRPAMETKPHNARILNESRKRDVVGPGKAHRHTLNF